MFHEYIKYIFVNHFKITDDTTLINDSPFVNIFQVYLSRNLLITHHVTIEIQHIIFVITGDIRRSGNIRLRETHSYCAHNLTVAPLNRNLNMSLVLSLIMQNYNAKLRAPQIGELLTNPN